MDQDLFLNILNTAHDIVLQKFPTATFINFERDLKLLGTPWIFTFRNEQNDIILKYFTGTGFAAPEIVGRKVGLQTIPLLIGLDQAKKLSKLTEIVHEQLYWALNPNVPEPSYVFFGANNEVVFVGAFDGKVTLMKQEVPATAFPITAPPAVTAL